MTYKKIFIILIFVASFSHLYAQNSLPNIETNRLKSTGGAGVGSILLEEASILNPASSAFFNLGSIYIQRSSHDLEPEVTGDNQLTSIIASDASGPNGGSINYNKLKSGQSTITQYGISYATPVGKKSSIGISHNKRKEETFSNGTNIVNKYNLTNIGVLHNVSETFSFGLVLEDAFRKKENNSRVLLGGQYAIGSYINIMLDIGSDYKENLSEKFLWRSALQVRVFNDFFVRFGLFNDKGINSDGSGIGLAWVQPKLSIEVSIKNSHFDEDNLTNQQEVDLKETTFSVSYRF